MGSSANLAWISSTSFFLLRKAAMHSGSKSLPDFSSRKLKKEND